MNEYKYITLRDKAELKIEAAEWFHSNKSQAEVFDTLKYNGMKLAF